MAGPFANVALNWKVGKVLLYQYQEGFGVYLRTGLLLLVLAACTPKDCFTERELRADGAAGFMMAQEISSRLCDLQWLNKSDASMAQLHGKIAAKFRERWEAMAATRKERYQRMYEAGWRQQMDTDNAEVARRIMAGLRLSPAVCGNLKTELEIRLASSWNYITNKLASGVRQQREKVKLCK